MRSAREFIVGRFPDAQAAILGGSAKTDLRTTTSDLDIVVFLNGRPAPFRETAEHDGLPVELFCHTDESFAGFVERETAARRSPLLHMCGEGVVLLDWDGVGRRVQEEARRRLRAGPPLLSAEELEDRRYLITDLLDDIAGSTDREELIFTADRLLTAVAESVLATRRRWQSHGKWLLRRFREADPEMCRDLLFGYRQLVCGGEVTLFRQVTESVLDGIGGRLLVGYRRDA